MRENIILHVKGFCYAYIVVWFFIGLEMISFTQEWEIQERLLIPLPIAFFTWISVFLAMELLSGLITIFGQVVVFVILFCVGGAGYAGLLATGHLASEWIRIVINKDTLQPIIVFLVYAVFPFTLQPKRFRFSFPRDPGEGGQRT